jgi:hypothetical protein
MSITIEVAETHPPQNGRKLAKVKTKTGEEFGIWPDKLPTLRVGQRYEIEVAESEFKGRTYRKITAAKPANGASTTAAVARAVGAAGTANEAERQFVLELLAAGVHSGAVSFAAADLQTAIAMLRGLWRDLTQGGQ